MKKILAGIAVMALSIATFTQAVQAAPLKVAVDTAFVPFEYKEGDKYVGFDIDLWNAIAGDLGLEYSIHPMDFNGLIPALQTRNVDVALAGMTITEERRQVIDFSDGYYDSGFILMVPTDSDIKGPEDLDGKVIAMKTGTSAANYAREHFKGAKFRMFPNIDNAYLELMTGRVDVAMHDTPNVLYFIKTAGDGKVKSVGPQMMGQEYGIAFPKGSPLVEQVNQALANIKADGRYLEFYKKWFGTEPPKK